MMMSLLTMDDDDDVMIDGAFHNECLVLMDC